MEHELKIIIVRSDLTQYKCNNCDQSVSILEPNEYSLSFVKEYIKTKFNACDEELIRYIIK